MPVEVEWEGKTYKFEPGKIIDILKKLGLSRAEVIPVLNGEVVTELDEAKEGDKLKLVRVWSGG